ncbi:MAG: META domain-containing protein [Flavobacteriales bacterium]|nr:META domain-containing protein [Flavobacteriales bacterium]MBK9288782.1 META domain-containing protein [Flavobacteriales bacterium]MBL0035681.1 META domain-containing protein [Flavobacteriales bacterium]
MRAKLPLVALALGLVLSASKCADKSGAMSMTDVLDKKWMLQSVAGQALQLPEGAQNPWIQLAADKSLSGFGGCNNLMGQFNLDGSTIGFPGVGSTKKYCESTQKIEDGFMGALREANSFSLDKGLLKLMKDGTELASFTGGK